MIFPFVNSGFSSFITSSKWSARAGILHGTSRSKSTQFNLQELVLLPQGMRSCPPPPPPLLSKQWSQTVTAFSTQPWLWSSSTDCLYLKMSQEKKSHSVTAHTTFHSTWTMINSASLYWCAWLWNSNFLFFVCVCVSGIPCRIKQQHVGYKNYTAAPSRIQLLQEFHQEYGVWVWQQWLFQTWLGKKRVFNSSCDFQVSVSKGVRKCLERQNTVLSCECSEHSLLY